jgi:hypothetical protein
MSSGRCVSQVVVYSGQVIPYLDGGHGLADVYELWQVCLTDVVYSGQVPGWVPLHSIFVGIGPIPYTLYSKKCSKGRQEL